MSDVFNNSGLVLEGGGMRGLYTTGVLDYFLERGIKFDHVYGVSAGAVHMTSYMAGQKGRGFRISTQYLDCKDYMSVQSLVKTGDMFGADFCYNRIPNELDPIDYDAFNSYPGTGYAVVTDIETGRPGYVRITDLRKCVKAIQASASLPLVSNTVEIAGRKFLDGGLADSIPVKRSYHDGNKKHVIILTRPLGYVKKPSSNMALIKMRYKKYPKLVEAMALRHKRYNATLDFIMKEELEGNVFVFRPEPLVKIDRIEKDPKKLKILYLQGYHNGAENYDRLMEYLNI